MPRPGGRFACGAIVRKGVPEISVLYLLNWLMPLYGLPLAQTVAEMGMAAMGTLPGLRG